MAEETNEEKSRRVNAAVRLQKIEEEEAKEAKRRLGLDKVSPDAGVKLTEEERAAADKHRELFAQGAEASTQREAERKRRSAGKVRPAVQPLADGGVVQADAGTQQDAFSKAIADASAAGTPVEIQSPDGTLARFGKTDAGTPPQAGFMAPEPLPAPTPTPTSYLGSVVQGVGETLAKVPPALAEVPMAFMRATGQAPPEPAPAAAPPMREPLAAPLQTGPAAEAAPTPAVSPQPGSGLPVGSPTGKEFDAGLQEQLAGLDALAAAEEERSRAVVDLQDRHVLELQDLQAQHEARAIQHQQQVEEVVQGILSDRIDPNRIWNNASVGAKVTAGIGILLSGIGQGLAGGPNLALQQINRIIDLDLEAQRENLGTKKGILAHYLQQGRDIATAYQMAKADLADVYAAQTLRVAGQFGGQEALARAQLAAGEMRQGAAIKRQEMGARDLAMAIERAKLRQAAASAALQTKLLMLPATKGGGVNLTSQMLELLPKDRRERAVRLLDGSYAFATSKEQAKDAAKAMVVTDRVIRNLRRYSGLIEKNPGVPNPLGGNRAEAQEAGTNLLMEVKELRGLGALQQGEIDLLEKQIADITSFTTSDATLRAKLDSLGRSIQENVQANSRILLGL